MFANQLIKELQEDLKREIVPGLRQDIVYVLPLLQKAQKIHIGHSHDMFKIFNNNFYKKLLFVDAVLKDVRLPFPIVYFDATDTYVPMGKDTDGNGASRLAFLCIEKDETSFEAWCFIYAFEQRVWLVDPAHCAVFLGEGQEWFYRSHAPNPEETEDEREASDKAIVSSLTLLNLALVFLSCKNITIINNKANKEWNAKRIKKGQLPIYDYYTLAIQKVSKDGKHSEPQDLWQNRYHLCRGHFKTYTAEHPLLGRFTGRYWWMAHARGRKELGVIEKDYEIDPPSDTTKALENPGRDETPAGMDRIQRMEEKQNDRV